MTETEHLAQVAATVARDFAAQAGRPVRPLELAEIVLSLKDRLIVWQAASVGTACKLAWADLTA